MRLGECAFLRRLLVSGNVVVRVVGRIFDLPSGAGTALRDFGGEGGLRLLCFGGGRNLRGESLFSGDAVRLGDGPRLGKNRRALWFVGREDGIREILVAPFSSAVPLMIAETVAFPRLSALAFEEEELLVGFGSMIVLSPVAQSLWLVGPSTSLLFCCCGSLVGVSLPVFAVGIVLIAISVSMVWFCVCFVVSFRYEVCLCAEMGTDGSCSSVVESVLVAGIALVPISVLKTLRFGVAFATSFRYEICLCAEMDPGDDGRLCVSFSRFRFVAATTFVVLFDSCTSIDL